MRKNTCVGIAGTAATESATKKAAGPDILHRHHGYFLDDLPGETENPILRAGLAFAGVKTLSSGSDDGVLTALGASNLDLCRTKLVDPLGLRDRPRRRPKRIKRPRPLSRLRRRWRRDPPHELVGGRDDAYLHRGIGHLK